MAPASIASTRYERRLDAAAAAGSRLAADFARRRARRGRRSRRRTRARRRSSTWRPAWRRRCSVAYVLWLLEAAAGRGTVRIHFLARDGQVLHAIARRLAPRLYPGIDCRYLAASRQIWTRAISASPDHHWLWYGDRPGTTVADLLRRLAVPGAAVAAELAALGFPEAAWSRPLARGRDRPAARLAREPRLRRRRGVGARRQPPAPRRPSRPGGGARHRARRRSSTSAGAGRCTIRCRGCSPRRGRARRLLSLRHRAGEGRDLARPAARLLLRREPRRGADIFARAEDRRGFLEVFCAADHGTVTGLASRPTAASRPR